MYYRPIMPNPGLEMQLANQEAGIGYIAVHPEHGVFLGVDEDKKAVYQKTTDIEPSQQIPAFYGEGGASGASTDKSILDCTLHKVENIDKDAKTVIASNVIDENGEILATDKGHFGQTMDMDNSFLARSFHSASHALLDWTGLMNVAYQKPAAPSVVRPK